MKRRAFLKNIAVFFLGVITVRFLRIFGVNGPSDNNPHIREAKHYTSGDHLAG